MAWKKVVLRGDNATTEQLLLDEEEVVAADDSIAFVDNSDSNYIKRESIVDFANKIAGDALDTDDDGVIDLSVAGLNANSLDDASSDLVLVWDNDGSWTTASLSDVGSAGTSGVLSITSNNGLSVNANATGAVSIELDTSTLSAQTVSSTTEFIVSNSDTEGVAAASAIGLQHFDNTTSAFIDLGDLSVGADATASGGGGLDYNSTSGVFTYTPPDLSSYLTTDKYASSWSWTGGTTAGPTGTLTITNGTAVVFGAIPAADGTSASGIVTTGTQAFAGNKTFNDNVIVTGNFTVNGTTTTVSTATLTVEDKRIVAAFPDVNAGSDAAQATNASGGGLALNTHLTAGTDDVNYAAVTWSSAGELTGWRFRDTAGSGNYAAAIMEFSADSTAPNGNAGGVGSFHFDTGNDQLYIRVS
jgi:hypothetical protein